MKNAEQTSFNSAELPERKKLKNIFCSIRDLQNESDVEALFVDRLLADLKYPDNRIRRKKSIEEITIGKGRKKEPYRPDYVLLDSNSEPKIVVDAKHPDEVPEDYHYQVSSYALYLNQKFTDRNPVLYTVLTNGHRFIVYPWDSERPAFYLQFEDFSEDNEGYLDLKSNLAFSAFNQLAATKGVFDFYRPSITTLIKVFNECHNLIRDKETLPPAEAFFEFCKIMFIKIREDGKIHAIIKEGKKPKVEDFVFSTDWINKESEVAPNPFDSILFRQIRDSLEQQIQEKKKKRIFEKDERLGLKAPTIFEIVKRLQNFDLYGIDEDLNGRMFETFLNATVRGKALGQFFTPRGVVRYMVETAPIYVSTEIKKPLSKRIPYILDGCCGSGGFLIESMAHFISEVAHATSLTDLDRAAYEEEIKSNHLFGVEANEKISRIARLNMYLHGDGGSKIFKANSLDKRLPVESGMTYEEETGINELRKHIIDDARRFDIVLTNPPFSMKYKSEDAYQQEILRQYGIAKTKSGAGSSSEQTNVLFIERYCDLLKEGTKEEVPGELLTIIDDTILNGTDSQRYRDYIFSNFIIIQVVSLPFNTFFRADANIKTSMLHLRRKRSGERQGSIFMAITNNIGHDDHSRDTPDRNNLHQVAQIFKEWRQNKKIEDQIIDNQHPDEPLSCPLQIFEVHPDMINPKRLDAFYYAPELRRMTKRLQELEREGVIELHKGSFFSDRIIKPLTAEQSADHRGQIFNFIEIGDVTIDGTIVKHRADYFEKLPGRARIEVKKGDIVFAKNNSSRGTTVLIPEWFDGGLVTTGFIGLRPEDEEQGLLLWSALESEIFRKQVYYLAITASQPEIREAIFEDEMVVPFPKSNDDREEILDLARRVESARQSLTKGLQDVKTTINSHLT